MSVSSFIHSDPKCFQKYILSQNVCTPNHRKAPWSHPKVYRHLINNIKSERDVRKREKICLGELNPCPRISIVGLVHSNTCLWSKETLFMRAKCIKEEHAVAPAPYLIWDSCYCSRKLSPMEGRFSKWFLRVKKGVINLFLCISMAYNVISCRKIAKNTQTLKIADFTM